MLHDVPGPGHALLANALFLLLLEMFIVLRGLIDEQKRVLKLPVLLSENGEASREFEVRDSLVKALLEHVAELGDLVFLGNGVDDL